MKTSSSDRYQPSADDLIELTRQLGELRAGLVGKIVTVGRRPNGVRFTFVQWSDGSSSHLTDYQLAHHCEPLIDS